MLKRLASCAHQYAQELMSVPITTSLRGQLRFPSSWETPTFYFRSALRGSRAIAVDSRQLSLAAPWRGTLQCSGTYNRAASSQQAMTASGIGVEAAAAEFLSQAMADPAVCINDPAKVQQKVQALLRGGAGSLHIISDFDMTLTKYLVNGKRNTTSHAVVAESTHTPQMMKDKTAALYQHYYPIEISHELTPEQKYAYMEEWWHKVHAVIVEAGLTRDHIRAMVEEAPIMWRQGVQDLVLAAEQAGVPVLVFSAGLTDVITEVLRAAGLMTRSMHVISNRMVFEEAPPHRCVDFEEPVIHVYNKNESALAAAHVPYFEEVAHRTHVLLLGDSLGDLRMSQGMAHTTCLTVGFLNHDVPQLLPQYRQAYDVVLMHDAPSTLVNQLLQKVVDTTAAAGAAPT